MKEFVLFCAFFLIFAYKILKSEQMKRLRVVGVLFFIACIFAACGNKVEGNPEADSLRNVLNDKLSEMSEMDLFLEAVNASMDSVVNMDGNILRT